MEEQIIIDRLEYSAMTRVIAKNLRGKGRPAVSLHDVKFPESWERYLNKIRIARGREQLGKGDIAVIATEYVSPNIDMLTFEEVCDLRNDSEFRSRRRKFMNWIHQINTNDKDRKLIVDIVLDMKSDYENYLRLTNIALRTSMMELCIAGTTGVIEDIIKLNIEKLVRRVFTCRKEKALLLLEEIKAPGREVSVLSWIDKELKKRGVTAKE